MLRSVVDLLGYTIQATDGEIGKVADSLFDDQEWAIRYLVVHTGNWLLGKDVLISPIAVKEFNWSKRLLYVNLTRKQIENSPDIDTKKPVSRQLEAKYFQYYSWPYYWTGAGIRGTAAVPEAMLEFPQLPEYGSAHNGLPLYEQQEVKPEEEVDPHLRSTNEIRGYQIESVDTRFGHVSDFLFRDKTWEISDLVIQTRNWLPGKSVLVPPEEVECINWRNRRLHIHLTEATIKDSKKYSV